MTGSYLGMLLDGAYFLPTGDTDHLVMETLTFAEFLDAIGLLEKYGQLNLYGGSPKEDYDEIREYYEIYKRIGGYPEVVSTYLTAKDESKCCPETKEKGFCRQFTLVCV